MNVIQLLKKQTFRITAMKISHPDDMSHLTQIAPKSNNIRFFFMMEHNLLLGLMQTLFSKTFYQKYHDLRITKFCTL